MSKMLFNFLVNVAVVLKEIKGNMDRNTAEGRILDQPIIARYIRIHPKTWSGHICMRVELFGCRKGTLVALVYFIILYN